MAISDFIKNKLELISRDNQKVFTDLSGPIHDMAKDGLASKKVKVPADGNWFTVSFDAVELQKDRLVVSAQRARNGVTTAEYDPTEKQYIVEFNGTRAAYLRGYYKARHPIGGWPFIWWDIRSYANHPQSPDTRVYVKDFFAHNEIRKLITSMEKIYGTSNIVNSYINDNLARFRAGINAGKTPEEIELAWSNGLMESLGYKHVEAFDTGMPKESWNGVSVHWCKSPGDMRG